jgi:methylene-fatty-acyl-phospholipid synthase
LDPTIDKTQLTMSSPFTAEIYAKRERERAKKQGGKRQ